MRMDSRDIMKKETFVILLPCNENDPYCLAKLGYISYFIHLERVALQQTCSSRGPTLKTFTI